MNRLKIGLVLSLALVFFSGCVKYKLNTGAYTNDYIRVVPTNAEFLIHPTGTYPAKTPQLREEITYTPVYREVDDMEQAVLDMREKGYVMIGYSAVNTRERGKKLCDERALAPKAYNNCVMRYRFQGIEPTEDQLGNPVHAAVWANASHVFVQKNYSFSRREVRERRIVSHEGVDVTSNSGFTEGGHRDSWTSSTYGMSNTKGSSNTTGDWDQRGSEAHADVGASGLMGPTVNIGGSVNESSGTNRSNTQYGENTTSMSVSGGGSRGTNFQDYGNVTEQHSKHWATALVEKNVDHYDYMVTFWKKADLSKVTLGVLTESVKRDLWPVLGTRSARMVNAVIGGSPAFEAEIWEGDILIQVNGEKIKGESSFLKMIKAHAGEEVVLTLYRGGQFYDVKVQLNET